MWVLAAHLFLLFVSRQTVALVTLFILVGQKRVAWMAVEIPSILRTCLAKAPLAHLVRRGIRQRVFVSIPLALRDKCVILRLIYAHL